MNYAFLTALRTRSIETASASVRDLLLLVSAPTFCASAGGRDSRRGGCAGSSLRFRFASLPREGTDAESVDVARGWEALPPLARAVALPV